MKHQILKFECVDTEVRQPCVCCDEARFNGPTELNAMGLCRLCFRVYAMTLLAAAVNLPSD